MMYEVSFHKRRGGCQSHSVGNLPLMESFCPPSSSQNSSIPLYRMSKGDSVSSRHPDIMKDLKRVYGKLTLQQKLVSVENMKRMSVGKAIAHKIGGKVPCTPVQRAVNRGAGFVAGGAERDKNPPPPAPITTTAPAPLARTLQSCTKQSQEVYMDSRDQSTIISGHGSHVPGVSKNPPMGVAGGSSTASTPASASPSPIMPPSEIGRSLTICGLQLSSEVCHAIDLICQFDKLETSLLDKAEHFDEDVLVGIMDVNDYVRDGTSDCVLTMASLAEYLALVRTTLLSAKELIPRENLSVKLRCAAREGGKVEKALIEGERLARTSSVGSAAPAAAAVSIPASAPAPAPALTTPSASKREFKDDENEVGGESQPKVLRRSLSPPPVSSAGSSLDSTEEFPTWGFESGADLPEDVGEKEKSLEEGGERGTKEEEEDEEVGEEEESFNKQEYHSRIDSHTKGMKAASINFDLLESDTEEDKRMTYAERRWAMMHVMEKELEGSVVEGYKSFVIGPTTPDTLNYLVVGCTPLDDKSVGKAIKDQASFSAATARGNKKSKALTNFTRSSLQSTFAPGSYAFSSAVRHERREHEKVNPWNTSITVPFKNVFATSDRQFRHIVWAQMLGEKQFLKHKAIVLTSLYCREISRAQLDADTPLAEGGKLHNQGRGGETPQRGSQQVRGRDAPQAP